MTRKEYIKARWKAFTHKAYIRWYALFHPIEKKAVFTSHSGMQYSCNPRAVSEKLHELYPDFKIVWAMNKNHPEIQEQVPDYVKCVFIGKKLYQEIATCAAYVTNCANRPDFHKRKGQFFIQTWHGDRPFKKVLFESSSDPRYLSFIYDNKITDLCIAASEAGVQQFRNAFRYEGEVLCVGTPRNDRLVKRDRDMEKKIKASLGIDEDVKLLLYAPTFRDNNTGKPQTVTVDLKEVLATLRAGGEKWICLIRAHVAAKCLDFPFDESFLDVSAYPDMADLLTVSDMLITDYSSCAGDFILRKKPTIMAMFDKEEYETNCRMLPFDIEKTHMLVAYTQADLIHMITTMTDEDFAKNCEEVMDFFKINETGRAAEEICLRIAAAYDAL